MAIPLLDLSRQYAYLKPELDRAVLDVLAHQQFILGTEVTRLEEEVSRLCGARFAVGVASGTDALLIALRAVGVEPGDEVIVPNFSFFATAGVVSRLHARPVFVDIEPDGYNIDAGRIDSAITKKTKAILVVHLYGQSAEMDAILKIAERHDIAVVEDAAQAIGAQYKGKPVGSIGKIGCFSFFPSKNLGGSGDGGMIVTNSEEISESCRMLRTHGEKPKYYHRVIGYNSRLDTLQAATLLVKLPHLRAWSEKRREHARAYDDAFAGLNDLIRPVVHSYANFHIYNQYTLASSKRVQILQGLKDAEIGHAIYYPVPFHQQDCFADLGIKDEKMPISTRVAREVFSIPVYPELSAEEQSKIIDTIKRLVA